MSVFPRVIAASAVGLFILMSPTVASAAETVTANCTGMLDLNVYEFDPTLATQEIEGIGNAGFVMNSDEIRLSGDFGEYRFDLKAGTLYHNGNDTGLYCTYKGLEG